MKKWRSFVAITLVVLLVLGMFATVVVGITANAASVSDMQDELDDVIARKEALEKELKNIEGKKDALLEQKSVVDEQINNLNSEADLLQTIVDELDVELQDSESRLKQAEEDYDQNSSLAKERFRATYELGNTSYVSIILNSKSIHDFISRVEVVKQVSAFDRKVIGELKKTKETIATETAAIKEKKEKHYEEKMAFYEEQMMKRQREAELEELKKHDPNT